MPEYLHRGKHFTGPVVYVGDGDSLCVAVGRGPGAWVEVRLADFYAPEISEPSGPAAARALQRMTMGRVVSCIADHRSYDRVAAVCWLDGVTLGDRLRAAGVQEGGRGR